MRKRLWTGFLAALLLTGTASAEQELKPQTQGGVTFVSGGIGIEERQALKKLEGDYNLRLLFAARGSREYIADVKVTIRNTEGVTLLEAVADGPRFLARLVPGTYRVIADNEGKEISRSISIPPNQAISETFTWKIIHLDKPLE
jgi:hypothetical protein